MTQYSSPSPTVAVTSREGGEWIDFMEWVRSRVNHESLIHSIKFADGSIWDAVNGWRAGEQVLAGKLEGEDVEE